MRPNLFKMTYLAVLVTFAVVIHTVEAALPLRCLFPECVWDWPTW